MKTFTFTVLTSLVASLVGLGLYLIVQPGTIDPDAIAKVSAAPISKKCLIMEILLEMHGY